MRFCYRQMIEARVRYVEESRWWRENKGCKIGKSLEDFERANIIEAAKEYRVQLGKLKKSLYRRG